MLEVAAILIEDSQFDCLTEAIYHESRSEPFKGQLYVGYVIKNRVESDRWPDSYCEVINEPYQFSYVKGAGMFELDALEVAKEASYMVMTTPAPIPMNVYYYHTIHVRPAWDYNKLDVYDTVGSHKFYALKPKWD